MLNVGLLENTTMGRFFLQAMLAVAEMERNMIIERVQEGLELAKKRNNIKLGRPHKFNSEQIRLALSLTRDYSLNQVARMTGISKSTLVRAKTKQELYCS